MSHNQQPGQKQATTAPRINMLPLMLMLLLPCSTPLPLPLPPSCYLLPAGSALALACQSQELRGQVVDGVHGLPGATQVREGGSASPVAAATLQQGRPHGLRGEQAQHPLLLLLGLGGGRCQRGGGGGGYRLVNIKTYTTVKLLVFEIYEL